LTTYRVRFGVFAACALLLVACSSGTKRDTAGAAAACSNPADVGGGSAYQTAVCDIPAPSLAGNRVEDPAVLSVFVMTPQGYQSSDVDYPVVYLLAGYTDSGGSIAEGLSRASTSAGGDTPPIFVIASGVNAFGGSFYVNSTVTGNWEDAIVTDLVGYVDANYRTLAQPAARGITGHSMGGFGALNIAMRRPDVFGTVYALSPGLFDPSGAQQRLGDSAVVDEVLRIGDEVAGREPADALDRITSSLSGEDMRFEWAYGAAFAPDPDSPTLMRFPYQRQNGTIVRDEAVWATWEGGFGGLPGKIDQFSANLRRLNGIGIDYGTRDEYSWIPRGCAYFVSMLKSAGIQVTEATFDGGHQNQLERRLIEHMLPFMAQRLSTQG
jgi:S-formylglutathione hydrolase FrmB